MTRSANDSPSSAERGVDPGAHLGAVEPLHHDHPVGGELVVHLGDHDGPPREAAPHLVHVGPLPPEGQLLDEGVGEVLDGPDGVCHRQGGAQPHRQSGLRP